MIITYISFVIGATLMLCIILLVAYRKDKRPRNKVKFFIRKIKDVLYLNICNKENNYLLCTNSNFHEWGLNPANFVNMKEGEIKEVFLNLED